MSESLRYKIVLWMVWVQIALLPVIYLMLYVTNNDLMWRWNLVSWLMVGGYLIGLLALPVSRGLEKPRFLKWWLRIDFWFSAITAILALPLLFYVGRHYIDAEDGDYVLYHTRGLMMAAPHYGLGKKEGLFIRRMYKSVQINDYGDGKIDCFKVDTLRGCFYGLSRWRARASWVLPLDSVKYHQNAAYITNLIDSLYQAQPLFRDYYHGTFVFPDNFAGIYYDSFSICYEDSISYNMIDRIDGDSLHVKIINNGVIEQSYPKDSAGDLSPREVKTFVEKLKGGKR